MDSVTLEQSRLRISVRGAVQGVGFRPFIFRLASTLGLAGWVNNSPQGVFLEVEGDRSDLQKFLLLLETEKPANSSIQSLETSWLDPIGFQRFEIRKSETGGAKNTIVLPDIATCPECLREIFDPRNRRYLYPFTNCTHCGPRFSIMEALPYDRANTSMRCFEMCPRCRAEYEDPRDRRFHAQPNACPACGPHLELWNAAGDAVFAGHEALRAAVRAIGRGRIVALKGIGGFHLLVAAHIDRAVQRLRNLKHREEKPFALMFPSLDMIKENCEVSELEEGLLWSPEAPIVLLHRRCSTGAATRKGGISPSVAPGNPNLAAMLPYTPLHHLLMSLLNFPIVATSGNLSDEPICIDEHEALERLGGIADLFLVHNRPVVRHVDDSIVRMMAGREMILRRARGYAPLPIRTSSSGFRDFETTDDGGIKTQNSKLKTVLAVGAHLKNAVAVSSGSQAFVSQHIGDLETDRAFEAFRTVIGDLKKMYELQPAVVVCDQHPDYLASKFARELTDSDPVMNELRPTLLSVQHHVAHVLSCMAENELSPPALGISWDGTGYGADGSIWGGEFFRVTESRCERVASFRPFRLLGGDRGAKEPRRTALSVLFEMFGDSAFEMKHLPPIQSLEKSERATFKSMLKAGINSPLTSSVGRLFDAIAALIGLRQKNHFEGQAAMELEFALEGIETMDTYGISILDRQSVFPAAGTGEVPRIVLDWAPAIRAVLSDLERGTTIPLISARFHNALVDVIVRVAHELGEDHVVLSGGCFQNRYLTEHVIDRLTAAGLQPHWHRRVPPNDGGIALGQIAVAERELEAGGRGGARSALAW